MRMRLRVFGLALVLVPYIGAQQNGWRFVKDDPATKKHLIDMSAESFEQTGDGHTKYLHNVTARIYDSNGKAFQTIHSKEAVVNFDSGTLTYGPQLKTVLSLNR
jgi:hypothetical protein